MDADAELLEALLIMFAVIAFGLLSIMGVFGIQRFIYALFSVSVAFVAWGLIGARRLNFLHQRMGRFDQMFYLTQIYLLEFVSCLLLLLLMPQRFRRRDPPNLEGLWIMMLPFMVGLAITGYGMGVFFPKAPATAFCHGGVYFITIGLMVVIAGIWSNRGHDDGLMAGVCTIIYILVVLVATYIAGDW